MNIAPSKALPILFKHASEDERARYKDTEIFIQSLAKIESTSWLAADEKAPPAATQLVGNLEVLVPLKGLIDTEAELARLDKEIGKLEKDIARIAGKLSNEKFVANAPQEVIAKEQAKLNANQLAMQKLSDQQQQLKNL